MLSPELLTTIKGVFIQFMNPPYVAGVVQDKLGYIKTGKAEANSTVTTGYKVFDVAMCPGFWQVEPLVKDMVKYTADAFLRDTMSSVGVDEDYNQARFYVKDEMDQLVKTATSIAMQGLKMMHGTTHIDPQRLEHLLNMIDASA